MAISAENLAEQRANDMADESEAVRLAKEAAEKAAGLATGKLACGCGHDHRVSGKADAEVLIKTTTTGNAEAASKEAEQKVTGKVAADINTGSTPTKDQSADGPSEPKPISSPPLNSGSKSASQISTPDPIAANKSSSASRTDGVKDDATKDEPDLLQVGSTVPDFNCGCHDGSLFQFKSKELKNGIVFFFFLQGSTVGDRDEAKEFQLILGPLQKRGYRVVGISTDPVLVSLEMVRSLNLAYPLLCDVEGQVCMLFGVSYRGYTRHKARRTVFVVNPKGVISYIDMHFKPRGGPTALMYKHCPYVAAIDS